MNKTTLRFLLPASLALSLAGSGCAVESYGYASGRVYSAPPPVEFGYEPMLYDGYVVYYTDDGSPFYWSNGVELEVPFEYRQVYWADYRQHRTAYRTWAVQRGTQYRTHRYALRDQRADRQGEAREAQRLQSQRRDDRRREQLQAREQQARERQNREQQARERQNREQQAHERQDREQQARERRDRERQARDRDDGEQRARDRHDRDQQPPTPQADEQQKREHARKHRNHEPH